VGVNATVIMAPYHSRDRPTFTLRQQSSSARLLVGGQHVALAFDPGRSDVLLIRRPSARSGVRILCGETHGYIEDHRRLLRELRRELHPAKFEDTRDLRTTATRLNELVEHFEPLAYVTATLADLRPTAPVEIVSAGGPPILIRRRARFCVVSGVNRLNRPLGLARSEPRTSVLPSGARALICSAGLPFAAPDCWLEHAGSALVTSDLLEVLGWLRKEGAAAVVIQTAGAARDDR
jgi:hypothetical protein